MKQVSISWLRIVATCLCLTTQTWAQSDYSGEEASVSLGGGSGGEAAVRLGDPSASIVSQPDTHVQQTQAIVVPEPVFDQGGAFIPLDDSVGFASTSNLDRIMWRAGVNTADQYGIKDGYTNINAFIPISIDDDRSLWWVNPRAIITDAGDGGANIGFGRRFYVPEEDRVYGASFWWNHDTGHHSTYNSLGGSFESIGRYFSLRGNFALPVGTKTTTVSATTAATSRFQQDRIVLDQVFMEEHAYKEFDFEVATPMPLLGEYGVDFGIGAYYLSAEGAIDAAGLSLRAQTQVTEDIYVSGLYTNDKVFDSNFSINVEVTMPQGMPSAWFQRKPVVDALTSSVLRRYRVPSTIVRRDATVDLMSPKDGMAIRVAHIDPNLTVAGDGTVDMPFMSLADYESQPAAERADYDIIFVRQRVDDLDTNLNTTITLFDCQSLFGDGTLPNGGTHTFETLNRGTQNLPTQSTGLLPLLSNSAATGMNVVTLANSNQVAGFRIDAGNTADGISGTAIDGFNINNNQISNAIRGVNITSDTSAVTGLPNEDFGRVAFNTITGPTGTMATGFGANQGVSIEHTAGTLDLFVSDNTISGYLGEDENDNDVLDMGEDVDGDGALDEGVGFQVIASGGVINADDFANATTPTGFFNNSFTGNGTGLETTVRNTGVFNIALVNNAGISSNVDPEGAGWLGTAVDGGRLNIIAAFGNTINGNAGDGVRMIARNGGTIISAVPEDTNGNGVLDPAEDLNGNGALDAGEDLDEDGVLDPAEDVNGNGVLDFGFFGNLITNNADDGIELLADNSVMDFAIGSIGAGNTITGNGSVETVANNINCFGNGILLTTLNGGTLFGQIDGNLISRNIESGIKIAPDMGVVDLTSISGNVITLNGIDATGTPIPLECNAGDAIVYAPSNGGRFNVGAFTGNTIQGNRGAIIRVGGDGGIIDLGIIEETVFDRTTAGTAGILFDADNATITGILRNNTFIGSNTNGDLTFGLGGTIRGGTLDLTIEDNIFMTNADAGIGLILSQSDNRVTPGTGTPIEGDAVEASLVITGNVFQNTLAGNNPDFDGSAISLQLVGDENDALLNQNDIDGDGIPDATTIPLPNGSDVTNNVQPAAILEGVIANNLIGSLSDVSLGNAGAGIHISVAGDAAITDLAAVSSTIDNPILTGMIIGESPGTAFAGNIIANNQLDGIRVRRSDNGVIDNFRIDGNVIQNNREDGIDIVGENNGIPFGVEEILDFEINGNQILSNGFLSDGTQGNAGRGIQLRADAGVVELFNIRSNLISGNRMSGIEARTFTDTHLFIGGGRDSSPSVLGGDEGVIYGVWQFNEVTDNGFLSNEDANRNGLLDAGEDTNGNGVLDLSVEGHGIALGRIDIMDPDVASNITEGFNNGGVLVPDFTGDGIADLPVLSILDNVINENAEDGLHVYLDKDSSFSVAAQEFRTTRIEVLRNDISGNGEDGFSLHTPIVSTSIISFNDNLVTENGLYSGVFQVTQAGGNVVSFIGDGMEIMAAGSSETDFTAFRNRFNQNNGRGVNILSSEITYLKANFEDNSIASNTREGFYMVNAPLNATVLAVSGIPQGTPRTGYTADTWLADFDSNHEMYTYGHLGGGSLGAAGNTPPAIIAPFLIDWANNNIGPGAVTDLTFRSNIVDNNGSVVPDSDGEDPYSTLGGFVMRTGTSGILDPADPSIPEPFITGGVRALIEDNRFSGNFGRDYMMDGFVATEPPNFSIMPDPLIRIDLQFRNNRGGSIDVAGSNFSVFYNNTAPAPAGNAKSPNPPFGNAARLRDATVNHGVIGLLGPFPGFGLPTLRIESDGSAFDPFGNSIGNNEFNLIYTDFNTFEWLSVPVGSLPDPVIPVIPAGP